MEHNIDVTAGPDTTAEPETVLHLGDDAPRGAKAVLGRIIKDGAKVPLFLGQTLISSLRDLGYNDTTSAICELVDNSIQWGATEIRVYFNQTGSRGNHQNDVLVLDKGKGMAPHVLKVATAFGGSEPQFAVSVRRCAGGGCLRRFRRGIPGTSAPRTHSRATYRESRSRAHH